MKGSKFEVGDLVCAYASAWHRCLVGSYPGLHRDGVYLVLAVNAAIPVDAPDRTANTLIRNVRTDEIIAINDCNLFTASHYIVIDDKKIEISHKSYLALKESLGIQKGH